MRYLLSVIDDTTGSATPAEMAAIDAFNERLVADGHWVLAGGLAPPGSATTIDHRSEEVAITSGPFVASEQYVSGFWVIEAPDDRVALALAVDASLACGRQIELRSFLGG